MRGILAVTTLLACKVSSINSLTANSKVTFALDTQMIWDWLGKLFVAERITRFLWRKLKPFRRAVVIMWGIRLLFSIGTTTLIWQALNFVVQPPPHSFAPFAGLVLGILLVLMFLVGAPIMGAYTALTVGRRTGDRIARRLCPQLSEEELRRADEEAWPEVARKKSHTRV